MINQLYTFSVGQYVVADEWNANFDTLLEAGLLHEEAIDDANQAILFQGGDYTSVYNVINIMPNSYYIAGSAVVPTVDTEYYKEINSGEELSVIVSTGQLNGEARIVIKTNSNRMLSPVVITYNGTTDDVVWQNGIAQWYSAGMKFIFLLERNGKLYVKMIATE